MEGTAAVAASVRAEAARRGFKQVDLAAMLGLSQAAMSRKLHGLIPFTIAEVYELADVMDLDATELVPLEPVPTRPPSRRGRRLPRVDSNHQPAGEGHLPAPFLAAVGV
jgi:transcriptional regulator with XRE-family HTH domain